MGMKQYYEENIEEAACTMRLAKETDLDRVNELRRQVNTVHVEGRPDIFKPGFCREMQEVAGEILQSETEILSWQNETA